MVRELDLDEFLAEGAKGDGAECEPWWCDPKTIPPREFLYSRHFIRKDISATIGAGGRGKTSNSHVEAVSMAVGRNLMTGQELPAPLRVLILNGEETQDELDRRLAAVCQRHGISQADLSRRLFVRSVRAKPPRFATLVRGEAVLNQEALSALEAEIRANAIDIFILDPLISFHRVRENINEDMDLLIKEGFGGVASRTNSAGELLHHPGKPKPGAAENTVEDARGASAIIWAVRNARVFNFMTPDEAGKLGIPEDRRRRHIRISNGKANVGPLGKAEWITIQVEILPNGDEVACASRWSPPNPFDGISSTDMELARQLAQTGAYRADPRSPKWFGYALAEQLHIPITYRGDNDAKDIARLKSIIKTWLKNKALKIEIRKDDERKDREFIVAGSFASRTDPTGDNPHFADDDITLQ